MEKNIQELIEISQFYGLNIEYVIAGGGNTSYKNSDNLWIKASGISLSDIQKDGFVCMSRKKLQILNEKQYSENSAEREEQVKADLLASIRETTSRRPSVETSLHNLVNYAFVVHTHPTIVNALLCSKDAERLSYEILGDDILFIPYTGPGYILFKKVSDDIPSRFFIRTMS